MLESSDTAKVTLIGGYLEDALRAEVHLQAQMRSFVSFANDDEDAQALFAVEVQSCEIQLGRLRTRLQQLNGPGPASPDSGVDFPSDFPRIEQAQHGPEEQLLHALIAAYTLVAGECAVYERLIAVAGFHDDAVTCELAHSIQKEKRRAAGNFFHFLSSRSKIAFNMLTLSEIDVAVQTKALDNRRQ